MSKHSDSRDVPIRRHIIMYLNVLDAEKGTEIGWLGDMSENGIMIISETRLRTDMGIHIKLKLPESESFNREFADLHIELLWTKPDQNPKYFCQGGLITDIPEDSRKDIDEVIRKYGFADNRALKDYTDYTV
ncbi:MAG: hypothetical protein JEZ04_16745 [Spirochaetales bacterium]|nr:hypothetical protein [Spirochaetales bacterium]